jgi:hypothetical protein
MTLAIMQLSPTLHCVREFFSVRGSLFPHEGGQSEKRVNVGIRSRDASDRWTPPLRLA